MLDREIEDNLHLDEQPESSAHPPGPLGAAELIHTLEERTDQLKRHLVRASRKRRATEEGTAKKTL